MSEQINEQAEKMREMAQTTLDKAKDAVSKYMAESQKLREKADSGVRATYSSAKEMNDKADRTVDTQVARSTPMTSSTAGRSSQAQAPRRRMAKTWQPSRKMDRCGCGTRLQANHARASRGMAATPGESFSVRTVKCWSPLVVIAWLR